MSVSRVDEMTTEEIEKKIKNIGQNLILMEVKIWNLFKKRRECKKRLEIYRGVYKKRIHSENGFNIKEGPK